MENEFDVIILGTGLTESITAAALAKAKLKVAHVDPNVYYGADEATLPLDEIAAWAERHSSSNTTDQDGPCIKYEVEYCSAVDVSHPKQYALSLSPSVIPAVGPFITSIIASGVARYGEYKLLGPVSIYHDTQFKHVPRSKEDVFRDQRIPLIEKRRLMRFLVFAAGEYETSPEFRGKEDVPFSEFLRQTFSLSEEVAQIVTFALGYCSSTGETTSSALPRVRSCLKSTGRYGPSPFLVGYYGGSGELAQGFCRSAAVHGAVYILGRRISNIAYKGRSTSEDATSKRRYTLELDEFPEPLHASYLISSPSHVPAHLRHHSVSVSPDPLSNQGGASAVARGIVVVDGIIPTPCGDDEGSQAERQSDSYIMVFPPGSINGGSDVASVHALTAGPGTMCAPAGKSIIYLSMPLQNQEKGSKELLEPYLTTILSIRSSPYNILFQMFYVQRFSQKAQNRSSVDARDEDFWVVPALPADTSHSVDYAAQLAEKTFWKVVTPLLGSDLPLDVRDGFWVHNSTEEVEDSD
ncbi:hypothetical protein ID866_7126 [Astraeus odoratus]|nr:hypothetical protein ID866_7126 [Astraeus odoratus]